MSHISRCGFIFAVWTAAWVGSCTSATAQTQAQKNAIEAAAKKVNALRDQGKLREAVTATEEFLALTTRILGPRSNLTAAAFHDLGSLHMELEEYQEAEPLYRQSLAIWQGNRGKDHPSVGTALGSLGVVYERLGQYERAESFYHRSLQIKEANLGKNHIDVALAVHRLATLGVQTGKYGDAEPLYRRSLAIYEANLKDGVDGQVEVGQNVKSLIASASNGLASVCYYSKRYDEAEKLNLRALELREATLGKDHPDVAQSLGNLGVIYATLGQAEKAESFHQRALAIREKRLGTDHPEVAHTLRMLGDFYAQQEQWPKAAERFDRAARVVRRYTQRVLPALSELEQLAFLVANDDARLNSALSLGLLRRDDPEIAVLSASWQLNSKGIGHEALAQRALLARAGADSKQAALAEQLTATRRELAAWTFRTPTTLAEIQQRDRAVADLTTQERLVASKLSEQLGLPPADDPWVELTQVSRAIPSDGVLVDVGKFFRWEFKTGEFKEHRYAAWVILPGQKPDVRLVDLGPAEPIDEAVRAVRQAIAATPKTIAELGERETEHRMRVQLDALSKLVLHPLLPHIGDRKRWLVSPDSSLWLVPWGGLTLAGGEYAIEKHSISFVSSGRDVIPRPESKIATNPPVILADPDFDLSPAEAQAETERVLRRKIGPPALPATTSGTAQTRFARLPGTATEAEAIRPGLEKLAGGKPYVYTDRYALEGVLKAVANPRMLVLSTHGFFLDDQETALKPLALSAENQGPARAKGGQSVQNPLLRCGLVLASANHRPTNTAQEDGLLTGLEIVGLDLRGCELVVLSACETGLGHVHNGEGVVGLHQAFQLAGAQSVISTLWQISDRDSALLMGEFFEQLAKGGSKAESLREAQLARIKAHRDRNGAAHPFYWAAFTLTGRDRSR